MYNKGIAVAGVILVDKINEIRAYPNIGELTQIQSVTLATGGCVPNVAMDLKRLQPSLTVKAVGKVGFDSEGDYAIDQLKNDGVDVSNVVRCENKTSFTEVMSVVGGQRTFFTYAGANAVFGANDVDLDGLDVDMLHLGYLLLMDKMDNGDAVVLLEKAKRKGIKTSIDLVSENSDRYSLVLPCLKYTDNLIINEVEACNLTGIPISKQNLKLMAEKLKSNGVMERVVIHTPELSVCLSNDGYVESPSYQISPELIKGTTGAGDAFCAGTLLGIYLGLSDQEILTLASGVAATSLFSKDAVSGIKSLSQTQAFCKTLKLRK